MNTRTVGWPSAPATSAWTSSTPWSMAACSAISRTRSSTDLESISVPQVAQLALLSPKRKSGRKPTGQRHPKIRVSWGLYDQDRVEASEGQSSFRGVPTPSESTKRKNLGPILQVLVQGFGSEAYSSSSFCALVPGLITATFRVQS